MVRILGTNSKYDQRRLWNKFALLFLFLLFNIGKEIQAITLTEPDPLGGPEGKVYVHTSQRQSLLCSVHQVPGSGHSGSHPLAPPTPLLVAQYVPWSEPREPDEPPPPEILEQPSVYQVKNILDSRWRGSRLEYLVNWEGYGQEERFWLVRDDILDPILLKDFHRTHPNRHAHRGRGCPCCRLRVSGAALGGGGNVRDDTLPQPSTVTSVINHHLHQISLTCVMITCTGRSSTKSHS